MTAPLRHNTDDEAERTPWYTLMDEMRPESGCIWKPLWISPLARQRQAMENGHCSGTNSAEDEWRN